MPFPRRFRSGKMRRDHSVFFTPPQKTINPLLGNALSAEHLIPLVEEIHQYSTSLPIHHANSRFFTCCTTTALLQPYHGLLRYHTTTNQHRLLLGYPPASDRSLNPPRMCYHFDRCPQLIATVRASSDNDHILD